MSAPRALAPCTERHAPLGPCGFVEIEGARIHLAWRGEGPAVLLVHGSQAWAYAWTHQLASLCAAGYRAIAVDMPGNGYSTAVAAALGTEGGSRTLGRLLDALGIERALLIASSAAGLPVLDFALRRPERVAGLVLSSTCGVSHREPLLWRAVRLPLVGELMGFFLSRALVRANLRQAIWDDRLVTDELVSAYYEPLCRPGAWKANLQIERGTDSRWVEANLERLEPPAWVVWGEDDPWHPVAMGREFARRIPHASLTLLEHCGHLPQDEQPARFDAVLLEAARQGLGATAAV